jgi:CHASE2 domain-containing sensor protein
MTENVGRIDRVLRVIIGLALIAFAMGWGLAATGFNWIGWIGVVPLFAGLFGYCSAYDVKGVSTCIRHAH